MPLIVHGVTRATDAPPIVDARRSEGLDTVVHDDLAALVTATDEEELLPSRRNVLTHTRALETAIEHATVVPMRFGVLVPDGDALRADYLGQEADSLRRRLQRLDGRVELRLSGRYDEAAAIAAVLARDPQAQRLKGRTSQEAKMALGERIVAGLDALSREHAHQVEARLAPLVDATASSTSEDVLDAFRVSLLVARDRGPELDRAIDAIGEELASLAELTLTGPLPPYSFAEDQEVAWAS